MMIDHPFDATPVRVAPYCRVSTDDDDQINSLENQISYYTDLISRRSNWTMVDMYVDEGITGTNTKKRKDFKRLIDDAYAGKIDLILTKEVSRFARNTVDTLSYTRVLKTVGVGVFFLNDNIDTRQEDGEFRLTIMASVAQEESRKTSSRVKWGMKRQMERGYVFANTIFGFDKVKGSGKITINEEEAKIVRLIFHKFVHEGKGSLTIAKDLIEEGIPLAEHKRMKRWSATAITRILRNEKYVGDLLQKKTYVPDFLEHKSVKNKGQEEKVFIRDHHEGIVSRDIWNQAQAELERRGVDCDDKSRYSNAYWCSGKIFCGVCGSSCVVRTKYLKDKEKYQAWRCKEVSAYGALSGCSNGQINIKALESCIQFAVRQTEISESFIADLHDDIKKVQNESISQDSKRIQGTLNNILKKKEKLLDAFFDDTISKEEMNAMRNKYDIEICDIQRSINQIDEKNRMLSTLNRNLAGLYNKIKIILSQNVPTTEVYSQIVEKIIMYPTNDLDIYLKYIAEPICIHYESAGRGKNYKTNCTLLSNKEKAKVNNGINYIR